MRRILTLFGATLLALAADGLVWALSLRPHAPPSHAGTGGLATLEPIEINGSTQWISVRGASRDLPLLLYLAGGPCGSEMAWMRHYHAALERHYLVVNWDQRCAGKSYDAADWERLRPADLVADAGVLLDTLLRRFGQDRLLLVGNSWGSMLGVRVAARWPRKLHAYVGVTQQVSVQESDSLAWSLTRTAAQRAREDGDVETLDRIGPPPYPPDEFVSRYFKLIALQNRYGGTPEANQAAKGQLRVALTAPEYGALDRLHWLWSLKKGWETVYRALATEDLDFEREVPALEVPVYLLLGRHDLVVPPALAERWLARLSAPHKEIVWFERAGHTLMVSDAAAVDAFLVSLLARP